MIEIIEKIEIEEIIEIKIAEIRETIEIVEIKIIEKTEIIVEIEEDIPDQGQNLNQDQGLVHPEEPEQLEIIVIKIRNQ